MLKMVLPENDSPYNSHIKVYLEISFSTLCHAHAHAHNIKQLIFRIQVHVYYWKETYPSLKKRISQKKIQDSHGSRLKREENCVYVSK